MNLTQKITRSYIFFKFAICSIALLSLGETCHLKERDKVTVWRTLLLLSCYDCDSTRQHYDVTRFQYVLWRRTMHEWVMNIHYQTWIAQGWFINMIRTPSKQWGVCDKYPYFRFVLLILALPQETTWFWSNRRARINHCGTISDRKMRKRDIWGCYFTFCCVKQ